MLGCRFEHIDFVPTAIEPDSATCELTDDEREAEREHVLLKLIGSLSIR
jgi:hypothetical protein